MWVLLPHPTLFFLVSKTVVWLLFTLKFCRQTFSSISFLRQHSTHTNPMYLKKKKGKKAKGGKITNRRHKLEIFGCCCCCCCMLSGVISMVIFMQISQMGFMVSIFSRLCAHAPSLYPSSPFCECVCVCVSNSFSCVCFRSSLFFCFSSCISVLPHRLRNEWQRMLCTREHGTQYIKSSRICWPSQPQQQLQTTHTLTLTQKLNQSSILWAILLNICRSLTLTHYTCVCVFPSALYTVQNNSIIIFAIGTILLAHIICWIHLSKNTIHLTQWLHRTRGAISIVVLSLLSPLPSSSLILFYYTYMYTHKHSHHLLMDITFEEIAWFAIALISIEPPQ